MKTATVIETTLTHRGRTMNIVIDKDAKQFNQPATKGHLSWTKSGYYMFATFYIMHDSPENFRWEYRKDLGSRKMEDEIKAKLIELMEA